MLFGNLLQKGLIWNCQIFSGVKDDWKNQNYFVRSLTCLFEFWLASSLVLSFIQFKINLFIGFKKKILTLCATRIRCKGNIETNFTSCESQSHFSFAFLFSASCRHASTWSWETQLRGGVKPLCPPGWDSQLTRLQVGEGGGLGGTVVQKQSWS